MLYVCVMIIIMCVCYLSVITAFLCGHRHYYGYPVLYIPGKMTE